MTTLLFKYPAVALFLLVTVSSELPAQQPKSLEGGIPTADSPQGLPIPLLRVTGARASSTLTTAIHCSNNDAVPVSISVGYFDNNSNLICVISYDELPVGATSTFTTTDTAVFDEDRVCPGPAPLLGQGRVEIGVFPLNTKIICSAQVVSLIGTTPATLSSLDVFPAN